MSPIHKDRLLIRGSFLFSLLVGSFSLLVFVFMFQESFPVFSQIGIGSFFSDASWHPSQNNFNIVPMILSSLAITLGAILLSLPLGIAGAVFLCFYPIRGLGGLFKICVEIMMGIPSVVFGLWGLMYFVPKFNAVNPPGTSLLVGILVLTLMVVPLQILSLESLFSNLPKHYFEESAALGLSKFTLICKIILPYSKKGILSIAILSLGRAIGETTVVLMVCGNVIASPTGLFGPVRTLTANIALEMPYAMDAHRSALFFSGLALLILTMFLSHFSPSEKLSRS